MKELEVIYYDLLEVPADIKSIINIDRFGKLRYRKTTLLKYTSEIFKENKIIHFHKINEKSQIQALIDHVNYSSGKDFLLISSNFTIINKESFAIFLKKIKYIDSSISIATDARLRPLLKINKHELIDFLNLAQGNEGDLYELINERFKNIEKFTQETFFLEIKDYVDFVLYLQSNFELRYFNSINSTKHIITKRSGQKEKMFKEYSFYELLNDEMKLFFLRPFNYEESDEYAQYSLERLNILDVSLQWIHFSLTITQFKKLSERLFYFLSIRKKKSESIEVIKKVAENLYIKKVEDRIIELQNLKPFASIEEIIKNSTDYNSIQGIIDHYKILFYKLIDFKKYPTYISLSHGDLCFSNMLYDKRIDFIKLIDPKGFIKEEDGYMDVHYDIAKLSHSILGNYDFINNGLFELVYDNNLKVSLEISGLNEMQECKMHFKKILDIEGFSYPVIRLFEASLFLSMLPLHIDYPKKVVAYLLTGINILEEIEKNYIKK